MNETFSFQTSRKIALSMRMFPVHQQNRIENISQAWDKVSLTLYVNKHSASAVELLQTKKDELAWYPANINIYAVMPRWNLPVTALQFEKVSKALLLQVFDFKFTHRRHYDRKVTVQ